MRAANWLMGPLLFSAYCSPAMAISEGCANAMELANKAQAQAATCIAEHPVLRQAWMETQNASWFSELHKAGNRKCISYNAIYASLLSAEF